MAFEVKQIDPLDLQPRKAVGIEIPFSSKSVFKSNFQTKDSIKTSLINYFLTNKGERYLNPSFGSTLREKLFENINSDLEGEFQSIVKNALEVYFPRVKANRILIESDTDNNLIKFYLSYSIANSNITDELLINIAQ